MANLRNTPAYRRSREQTDLLAEQARKNRENQRNNANARNDKQPTAEELAKAEIKRKQKALDARKKYKQSIVHVLTPSSNQRQGAMEKAEHLAGLTAEGVAGEIGINLIIFSMEALGNTPWWVQTLQLQEALANELASLNSDKPERICYLPDDNGVFPEIYPADGEGKVDYSGSSLAPEQVTPFAIRANGYVPQPSMLEAFWTVCDFHSERMSGANSLSPDQKARMYNIIGSDSKKEDKNENDLASTQAALNAARKVHKPG